MKRMMMGLLALAAVCAPAHAQGTRDRLLVGNWSCAVTGAGIEFDAMNARFDPGGPMTLRFHAIIGTVGLAFTLYGTWTYNAAADTFGETISNAIISDIVVEGAPMTRTQFPGGEEALQGMEQEFMQAYSTSPLYFTTVTQTKLVITDTENAAITCGR